MIYNAVILENRFDKVLRSFNVLYIATVWWARISLRFF
jgi:hypothetical protein